MLKKIINDSNSQQFQQSCLREDKISRRRKGGGPRPPHTCAFEGGGREARVRPIREMSLWQGNGTAAAAQQRRRSLDR